MKTYSAEPESTEDVSGAPKRFSEIERYADLAKWARKHRLLDAVEEVGDHFISRGKSPYPYYSHLARFLTWCKSRGLNVRRAKKRDMVEFLSSLVEEQLTRATIAACRSALSRFYRALLGDGQSLNNPMSASIREAHREAQEHAKQRELSLSLDHLQGLIQTIPEETAVDTRDRAAIGTVIHASATGSDVASLLRSSLNENTLRIGVRKIQIDGEYKRLLRKYLGAIAGIKRPKWLFLNEERNRGSLVDKKMSRSGVYRIIGLRIRNAVEIGALPSGVSLPRLRTLIKSRKASADSTTAPD